jgi:hypothetical protein
MEMDLLNKFALSLLLRYSWCLRLGVVLRSRFGTQHVGARDQVSPL